MGAVPVISKKETCCSQNLRKLRREIDIRSWVSFQIVLLQICLLKFATATERVGDLEQKHIVWFSQSNKILTP